jgi:subtilase family protein
MPPRVQAVLRTASAVAIAVGATAGLRVDPARRPMSVHNRLLLNRLAVAGHRTAEVMLAVDTSRFDSVSALVARDGGRVRRSERSMGYLRVEVPLETVTTLVGDSGIEAYQISSWSKGSWYRDAAPRANADLYREAEVAPVVRAEPATPPRSERPVLTAEAARQPGYTADDDSGVGAWLRAHPSYDGRGVTIAFLETAQAEFAHPTLRAATDVDGHEVPKVAGILNTLDPEEPDDTRVDLSTRVDAAGTWCRVGNRTYILPRRGTYRLGIFSVPAGDSLVEQFAIVRDETTREIRVDTDGDGDFRSEVAVVDANVRFEPHALRLHHPRRADLAFVLTAGPAANEVHVYLSQSGHQAMTISVAAGSRTDGGLAFGVAPAARVRLVRNGSIAYRLHDFFEGYIEAAKLADVDILSDSSGVTIVPDTAGDFAGVFFRRLIAVYRKPVFHGAGNSLLFLNGVSSMGDAFSVGGSIGAATFSAFYGGGAIDRMLVHPLSAAGPALDGVLKPDFIAPVHRLAADVMANGGAILLPKNAPTRRLPRGYRVSCCTSASGPYAAGVAALLLSAARQSRVPWSVNALGRALRASARFLSDAPAYQQGAGVVDVGAAWQELQRDVGVPRIRVRGNIAHALAPYAADGNTGGGLFEREGWKAGSRGRRLLHFTRESGPPGAISYRVSWTGNDGTFDTASSVSLPLNEPVALPIAVSVASAGVHSAILDVHDPLTDAIVLRAAATIVAAERIDPITHTARFTGSVPLMRSRAHYLSVPESVGAIGIDLEVARGSLVAAVLPSHGLVREYYDHVFPQQGRTFTKGRYSLLLPRPAAGTWSFTLTNDSAWREANRALISYDTAEYAIAVRFVTTSVVGRVGADGRVTIDATNRGAPIERPALQLSVGNLTTRSASHLPSGLPNRFDIEVTAGASTLAVRARRIDGSAIELHLYDCSSGECFSHDFTVPAANEQAFVVRRPAPGRWVAAVNPAPFPSADGRFSFDAVVTFDARRVDDRHVTGLPARATWTRNIDLPRGWRETAGSARVLLCELVDAGAEDDARAHLWENRAGLPNLADASVALGATMVRLD